MNKLVLQIAKHKLYRASLTLMRENASSAVKTALTVSMAHFATSKNASGKPLSAELRHSIMLAYARLYVHPMLSLIKSHKIVTTVALNAPNARLIQQTVECVNLDTT